MYKDLIAYFRKNKLTDVHLVNQLIVSAYLSVNRLSAFHNRIPRKCLLNNAWQTHLDACLDIIARKGNGLLSIEDLVHVFEFVISPSDRVVNGSVYTPKDIRQRIIHECLDDIPIEELHAIRIADIACGCGGFLLDVAEYLHERTGNSFAHIYQHNLYGIDIQDYSIERTKLLLSLLALKNNEDVDFEYHLWCNDTLQFDFTQIEPFDVVLGNPPYVCWRNLPVSTRERMKQYEVCRYGNSDLYIPFFQIAIDSLREDGRMGYIVMNTFLVSQNGMLLRRYLHERQYDIRIVDFRDQQIFKGKNTYTCLFFLTKQQAEQVAYCTVSQSEIEMPFTYSRIAYKELQDKGGWRLNQSKRVADFERGGIAIGKFCASRHGIATLSNKTYIFTPTGDDETCYHLRKDGRTYRIEKDICRDIVNSNKFNSDVTLQEIMEKVIFPYRVGAEGRMEIIPQDEFRQQYPYTFRYLTSQYDELKKRDKGNQDNYPTWYAFGRTQSMILPRYKLFFPKIANHSLQCVLSDDPALLLYNGMAFVSDDRERLLILQKILQSEVFWSYVKANAKPYSEGYVSLNGDNIKHFHVPNFSNAEKRELLALPSPEKVDEWLIKFYSSI